MKTRSGFSLIEVLATIAIIGILAAIALPNYTDYLIRGRIPEATSALAAGRVAMEQFFQDNRTYVAAPACSTPATQFFTFACPNLTATTFTLVATGRGPMAGFSFTVNEAAARSSTAPTARGWAGNANCWVTKKGGQC